MDKGSARRDSYNDSNLKYTVKKHKNTQRYTNMYTMDYKGGLT